MTTFLPCYQLAAYELNLRAHHLLAETTPMWDSIRLSATTTHVLNLGLDTPTLCSDVINTTLSLDAEALNTTHT